MNAINMIIDKYKPTAFFISEDEVTPINQSWFTIKDYHMITSPTLLSGKSRLVCYLLLSSPLQHRPDLLTQGCLSEIIPLEHNNKLIVGVYRPFKLLDGYTKSSSSDEFFTNLDSLASSRHQKWFGGDFNINLKLDNVEATRIKEWQDDNALHQLVDKDTWSRIITTSDGNMVLRKSMIDHLYTSESESSFGIEDKWTSDHNLIVLYLPEPPGVHRIKTKTRSWRNYSATSLEAMVRNKVVLLDLDDDADSLNSAVNDVLLSSYNDLCPERSIRTARPTDIVSDDIERIKKKLKRKMAAYNKSKNSKLLQEISTLDKALKFKINNVRKKLIRQKMQLGNKRSFWDTVRRLQGEVKQNESIKINLNGQLTTNLSEILEAFASFFVNKVERLSNSSGQYLWARNSSAIHITENELELAVKSLKGKLCSGHDGVPLKIVKHAAPGMSSLLLRLMRSAARGIPIAWKTSHITPLHKSGSKTSVENYRPIANLVSVSKVFEKIILNKIDNQYPNIEGQFQHGFRKKRSTLTAMLELQSDLAMALDNNLIMNSGIQGPLLDVIMDFLSNRSVRVKVDDTLSAPRQLFVGCIQGSILGPKLFNIYCRGIRDVLPPSASLISYADDSYVLNFSNTPEELKQKTEHCLALHSDFLSSIGMVVNASKTELLYSSRTKLPDQFYIDHRGSRIEAKDKMKALGVIFTPSLDWRAHVDAALNKSAHTIKRIRYLSKWLTGEELLQLVTSQYMSLVFYAAPLWIGNLSSLSWKRLNSAHYRALRAALRDFRKKKKRKDLDKISKRATPVQWSRYIVASTVIKLYTSSDTNIAELLRSNAYVNDRMPRKARFSDRSRLKIGRQSLQNRIGPLFSHITFDWIRPLSDDQLRVLLKSEFMTQ